MSHLLRYILPPGRHRNVKNHHHIIITINALQRIMHNNITSQTRISNSQEKTTNTEKAIHNKNTNTGKAIIL